mmetsp:Transcript_61069/g.111871  ORF Transcript_61069/g.111871 Transcript_61069/m.111871 type:complete len:172 (+) Transcript_61069:3-518(+)
MSQGTSAASMPSWLLPARGGHLRHLQQPTTSVMSPFHEAQFSSNFSYSSTTPEPMYGLSTEKRHIHLSEPGLATTMMLRNIPCAIQRESLDQVLQQNGFNGAYDFIHMPTRKKNGSNFGYAFINFASPAEATRFAQAFAGYRFAGTLSTKECEVRPAHFQGSIPTRPDTNL